jgi:hypothetical protein
MTIDLSTYLTQLQNPDIIHALPSVQKAVLIDMMEALVTDVDGWPVKYVNRDTGRVYIPHTSEEATLVYNDGPFRYCSLLGGEGSGKSTAGIIKDLERVRRGMSGMMTSPNFPHFQRSLWKEFQRWCPWDCVIPAHRRMGNLEWTPQKPCDIVFENGAYIHAVGVKNAGSLEGPNLSWAHFDEARHYPDKTAITTLDGRIRVPGPNAEQPQMWYTTTPRMNWLFDYFGPVQCNCLSCGAEHRGEDGIEIQTGQPLICPTCQSPNLDIIDPLFSFKQDSYIVRLDTHINVGNLTADFAERRAQSLTESEARVLIQGKWGDIEEGHPFLPNMIWWDSCKETLPALDIYEPLVISLDAATGRQSYSSDCFAIVGVTRHPDPARIDDTVAVRFIYYWQARAGEKIDFIGTPDLPGPERVLLQLCGYELDPNGRAVYKSGAGFNVACVVYDPNELHSMTQRLTREGVAWFKEMGQTNQRYEADRQLLNLITHRRIAHGGEPELRRHIQNADRQLDSTGHKLRIVKRSKSLRIDLAVCTSMGAYQCLKLNL